MNQTHSSPRAVTVTRSRTPWETCWRKFCFGVHIAGDMFVWSHCLRLIISPLIVAARSQFPSVSFDIQICSTPTQKKHDAHVTNGTALSPRSEVVLRLATGSQSVEYFPEADVALAGSMKSLLAASSCDPWMLLKEDLIMHRKEREGTYESEYQATS